MVRQAAPLFGGWSDDEAARLAAATGEVLGPLPDPPVRRAHRPVGMARLVPFVHRRGLARLLHLDSSSDDPQCRALVEVVAPNRLLAEQVALWRLAHDAVRPRRIVWDSLTADVQRVGRFRWHVHQEFRRA